MNFAEDNKAEQKLKSEPTLLLSTIVFLSKELNRSVLTLGQK